MIGPVSMSASVENAHFSHSGVRTTLATFVSSVISSDTASLPPPWRVETEAVASVQGTAAAIISPSEKSASPCVIDSGHASSGSSPMLTSVPHSTGLGARNDSYSLPPSKLNDIRNRMAIVVAAG